jgi:hypothetical protein
MTTTSQIIDILFAKLKSSALASSITGGIYKLRRPADSKKEDVVINCLPASNTQLQKVIANVNIHVPDLNITLNSQPDTAPHMIRLEALGIMASDILADNWTDSLNYDVQQEVIIEDREAGDHYINIRIEFFIENL